MPPPGTHVVTNLKVPVSELGLGVNKCKAAEIGVRGTRPVWAAVLVRKLQQALVGRVRLVKDARLYCHQAHRLQRACHRGWPDVHPARFCQMLPVRSARPPREHGIYAEDERGKEGKFGILTERDGGGGARE